MLIAVQDPQPQQSDPTTVDDVIVTGVAPQTIERFVNAVTIGRRRGQASDQIARWTDAPCVKTIGGRPEANRAFSQQIAAAIKQLGVEARWERCSPNVMIVATLEPDKFSSIFTSRFQNRFFQSRRSEYRPFLDQRGPVRWGHSVDWTGERNSILAQGTGGPASGVPSVAMPNTRLRLSTAARIRRSLIVVDQTDIDDVPQQALAAYVAFAVLAELPRDLDLVGQDSILNLFRRDGGPVAFESTAWDIAFVRAVYQSDNFAPRNVQQVAIVDRMQGDLMKANPGGEADSTDR